MRLRYLETGMNIMNGLIYKGEKNEDFKKNQPFV
jgi:hypothetical protein